MSRTITGKKIIMVALSLMLIFSATYPVMADDTTAVPISAENPATPQPLPSYVAYNAVIKELIFENDILIGILADADGNEERFNIFDDTIMVDNENAIPVNPKSLKAGDMIFVYGSPAKTFSLPPQSRAIAILTNIDKKAPARYLTVSDINKVENGDLKILDTDNEYIITITDETQLIPYKTKQRVLKDDIVIGSRVLVWSEIMTLSLPAQMTADVLMLLPGEDMPFITKITISPSQGIISINDKNNGAAWHEDLFVKYDTTLVPLRKVSETLGYEVKWFSDGRKIELAKDNRVIKLQISNKKYDNTSLSVAPELINSKTFVPMEFFKEVLGVQVEIL